MKIKVLIQIILFMITWTIFLSLLSCSKKNPVSETDVSIDVVAAGGNVMNSNLSATLLRCDLLFDGNIIATQIFQQTQPSASATIVGTTTGVKKGSHTLAFRITSQTSSPNTYKFFGVNAQVSYSNGKVSSISLPDKELSVASGQSVSYVFDIP